MAKKACFSLTLGAIICQAALLGQQAKPFREETRTDPPSQLSRPEEAKQPLTPEMRGDIYMARKMYREAIEVYREVLGKSPVIHNKTGIAYHQLLQLEQAKRFYERSIRLNSKYSEAINNLGTIYYAQKSYRKAEGQYKKALKINPNSASILSNLGTAYFARKKYELAFETYRQALALDPEVFEHKSTSGVLLQERSVAERATFHFFLAKTYAAAGNHERALRYMRMCLEEGFKDKKKFVEDPEFASMQELPEFKELLTKEIHVL